MCSSPASWATPTACAARSSASTSASETLPWPGADGSFAASQPVPGTVEVAIRPEAVEIGAAGSAGLPGTVRKAAYIGGVMEYTIATELGELFVVSIAVDRPLVAGAPVAVTLASHGVVPIATA